MWRNSIVAGFVGSALAAGLAAAPASAGAKWSDPQQVSSDYGRQVAVSEDGEMAAWIRIAGSSRRGPVLTARYRGVKKGWSKPAQITGSQRTRELVLGGGGTSLLIKGATSYGVATRKSGNRWSAPETVAEAERLGGGLISADGRTVVWVDQSGQKAQPQQTSKVMSRTRTAGGSWGPAAEIGEFYDSRRNSFLDILTRIDLSQDGSTVVWMDPAARFVSSERRTDGSWSPPALIQGYPDDVLDKQIVIELHLSQDGSRVVWQSPSGVLTSTKSPAGWTPVDYVMQDEPSAVAMSPNGKVIAYGLSLSDTVAVKRFVSGKWSKQERLGPAKFPVLVVRNKAVAWLRSSFGPSRLRVSLLRKGEWTKPVTVAKQARPPGLSSKADTLVWADRKSGDIRSISR